MSAMVWGLGSLARHRGGAFSSSLFLLLSSAQGHRTTSECPHKSYPFPFPPSPPPSGGSPPPPSFRSGPGLGSVGNGAETGSCYATSTDGIGWTKPSLGVVSWNGSTANNIVMQTLADNGRGFLKDPNPAADPAERYKMFGQIVPFELVPGGAPDGGNLTLALGTSTSPDGIHWAPNVSIAKMVNAAADASNQLIYDASRATYFGLTRIDLFSPAGQHREAAVTTSPDFRRWTRAVEVLHNNASESGGAHPRQENSYVVFQPDGSQVWLGLVTFSEGPKVSWGRFVTELAWSPDLYTWHRLLPGEPFIPFGPAGAWDSTMTLGAAAPFLNPANGSELLIYYVGGNGPWKSRRDNSIGLGTVPRDHLAGLTPSAPARGAASGGATVTTASFPARLLQLLVTADVDAGTGGGSLTVVAEGPTASGGVLRIASVPVARTGVDVEVEWLGGAEAGTGPSAGIRTASESPTALLPAWWIGELVTLTFALAGNTTLYSFVL